MKYIIHSISEGGFWNKKIGWVTNIKKATQFSEEFYSDKINGDNLLVTSGKDANWIIANYEMFNLS